MMYAPRARWVSPEFLRQLRLAWFAVGLTAGSVFTILLHRL